MIEAPRGGLRRARVWDLDTRLPFPCTLEDYAEAALPPVREQYSRRARRGARGACIGPPTTQGRAATRAAAEGFRRRCSAGSKGA